MSLPEFVLYATLPFAISLVVTLYLADRILDWFYYRKARKWKQQE